MADARKPIKVVRDTNDNTTGLQEFTPNDAVGINDGGTGGVTVEEARQNLGVPSVQDLLDHINLTNPHGLTLADLGGLAAALLGQPGGVAALDAGGKIPVASLPAAAIPQIFVVADIAERDALTVQEGDEAKVITPPGHFIYDGSAWIEYPSGQQIYGSWLHLIQDASVSTTTSFSYQTKINEDVQNIPAGTYKIILSYGFNADTTSRDFQARFRIDDVQQGQEHCQEMQDSGGSFSSTGSNQKLYITRTFYVALNGNHNFKLQWRINDDEGDYEASIWDVSIEIVRVQ